MFFNFFTVSFKSPHSLSLIHWHSTPSTGRRSQKSWLCVLDGYTNLRGCFDLATFRFYGIGMNKLNFTINSFSSNLTSMFFNNHNVSSRKHWAIARVRHRAEITFKCVSWRRCRTFFASLLLLFVALFRTLLAITFLLARCMFHRLLSGCWFTRWRLTNGRRCFDLTLDCNAGVSLLALAALAIFDWLFGCVKF